MTVLVKSFSGINQINRNRSGGGVIAHVRDDIPSKQLTKHKLPECVFIEVNLRSEWKRGRESEE